MVEVVANTSRLSDADRAAIAAYLKAIPAAALAPI
jgi:cytochrome c553